MSCRALFLDGLERELQARAAGRDTISGSNTTQEEVEFLFSDDYSARQELVFAPHERSTKRPVHHTGGVAGNNLANWAMSIFYD